MNEKLSERLRKYYSDSLNKKDNLVDIADSIEALEAERDKLLPDASMFAGHSGIPDREMAWQLTYAAAKDVIKDLESRLRAASELVKKWRNRDIEYCPEFDNYSECADELEAALGVSASEGKIDE